ncbi:hypothetical protein, partial [Neptunomonas phycophila]|uniref:hypothetical protein n=1 Tax=Neptunomonas phycophila TaxID=1572645 RepID=UPI0035159CDF
YLPNEVGPLVAKDKLKVTKVTNGSSSRREFLENLELEGIPYETLHKVCIKSFRRGLPNVS